MNKRVSKVTATKGIKTCFLLVKGVFGAIYDVISGLVANILFTRGVGPNRAIFDVIDF